MASRLGDHLSPRPGYNNPNNSPPSGSAYRHHNRAQSAHIPRYDSSRVPRSFDHGRRRSSPLCAFVEDECEALAREHNPSSNGLLDTDNGKAQYPGEIDQVPILIEVFESNPERRFVLLAKTASGTVAQESDAGAAGAHTPSAPGSHVSDASSAPHIATPTASTISATASTITSAASTITPTSSPSTPLASTGAVFGTGQTASSTLKPTDNTTEYEANTCRKFTVPRIDAESTISEPSTISSQVDDEAEGPHHSYMAAAGIGAAAAATTAAAAGTTSKAEPEIKRRRSRLDLPRIDTGLEYSDTPSGSSRPRSATHTEHRSRDRHHHIERDSRDRLANKSDHRDNDFLSPAFVKHSTTGRDRAYFDHSNGSGNAAGSGPGQRARSGDARPPHDDRRAYDRSDKPTLSADPAHRRRSTSFCETDKLSRTPSHKRSSRDESASTRAGRKSPSPPPKARTSSSPTARVEKRPSSPPRNWDREREREREKERDRRGYDQDHDRQKPSRRDSVQMKRRDSIRPNDGYSSDERSKKSSANTPLRRQNSERRRPAQKDDESVISKASSNPDVQRPTAASDVNTSGRYRSGGTTPLATPKQPQTQFPFMTGSPPKELFEPRPSSPLKAYQEERRRKDDRRPGSSSSASSSPESHSRVPDGDRPRGPRPRAHAPNVIHNPTSASSSLPNLPHSALQSRASTLPMPIPIPVPISIPSRGTGSVREREESRHERRRSPVDTLRSRPSLSANPARTSSVFGHSPSSSQPYRQPAFYINLPGATTEDGRLVNLQDEPSERQAERPLNIVRPAERTDRSLVPIYRRYAEDVHHGRVQGLPECPRQTFSTKYRDWRTLAPFDDFLICPKCFDGVFARTPYRNEFVPAPAFDPKEKTRCTFGSMHWYQVAFFFAKAFQMPTLSLLKTMFTKDEELRHPCPGPARVAGRWFTVQDPVTARPVAKFSTCEQCATAIQVLFPRLKGFLQDNEPSRYDTTNICALYFEPDRKRLWKYIDVLETVNNSAVATGSPVDVDAFINKLLDVSHFDECKRDIPVRGRKWYWMRSIPDFIVCQECFDEAVYPKVNSFRGVAGDFYKEPKELPLAACHLYSPRMREIFLRACQNNDKEYLEKKLRERDDIAADITNRIQRLPKAISSSDVDQKKLMAEWKKWE